MQNPTKRTACDKRALRPRYLYGATIEKQGTTFDGSIVTVPPAVYLWPAVRTEQLVDDVLLSS